MGILEADIKQVEMKKSKRVSQENEKDARNQIILQESHRKHKHLGCSPWNSLEVDEYVSKKKKKKQGDLPA